MLALTNEQKKEVIRFCKFFIPEASIYIFGSRATGKATDRSDLDIALKSKKEIPYRKILELKDALNNSDLPFHCDVIDWALTSESFKVLTEPELVLIGE